MNSIEGRVEAFGAQSGLVPRIRFTVDINNRAGFAIDLANVVSRAFLSFSENGRREEAGMGEYMNEAYLDSNNASMISEVSPTPLRLLLPLNFDLLGRIEELRRNRDVIINLGIRISGTERLTDGKVGSRIFVGDVVDSRASIAYISLPIARSTWEEYLNQWKFPSGLGDPSKRIQDTLQKAQAAITQAEEAVRAAKSASELTAVVSLSEAYSEEAEKLWRRSIIWLLISVSVAVSGGYVMFRFVSESLGEKFSLPEATVRAVVIAATFGVFTLCLRIFEAYCHLEVVNRHRVNIGRTFEAFKAAQPTERAKEVMSAITADNLLAFGKSGFGGKDSPNQGPLAGTNELINSFLERHTRQ